MAEEGTVVSGMAGRYAQALFELAKESKTTDQVAADLASFRSLVNESDDFRRFVKSPVFTADEQIRSLNVILTRAGIAGQAAKFLKLVAAKRRLFAVDDMITGYNRLYDASRAVTRASITVAEPLKDAHIAAVKEALAQVAGSRSVEVAVTIDPAILGGMIVKLGSRMIDSSLRTKLNSIRTRMKEVG